MRLEDLVDKVASEDREAAYRLGELLKQGDAETIRVLSERLRKAKGPSGAKPKAQSEADRFNADLLRVAERVTSKPAETADELEALHLRAQRIGPCETLQIKGLQSRRLMLLGQLDAAKATLEQARRLEGLCRGPRIGELTACTLEMRRRTGLLYLYLGELDTALQWTQSAIDGYEVLAVPGHDLNRDGWATSVFARARVLYEMGEFARAADDWNICVCRFKPTLKIWSLAQHNLAAALAETGTAGRLRAYERLEGLRYSMRRGPTVERATFYWLDGQLRIALRERRGLPRLRVSLDLFAKVGTPKPYIGVASDILRAMYPNRERMKEFLDQIKPVANRLITDDRHRRELAMLAELVTQCPTEKTWPRLRQVIQRLRDLAEGGGSLVCLIPWRPCRLSGAP